MTEQEADSVKVVLFFDANMPSPINDLSRFPPSVWATRRPAYFMRADGTSVPFNRIRDLEVSEWCLATIRDRWADAQGRVLPKRYVLVTHDQHFVNAAENEDTDRREKGEWPLEFSVDEHYIRSGIGVDAVTLEVFTVEGNMGRERDLVVIMAHAQLLCA